MKQMKLYFRMSALLMAATMVFACSNNDDVIGESDMKTLESNVIHFKATVKKDVPATRALSDEGDGNLNAVWNVGEKMALIYTVGSSTSEYMVEATIDEVATDGTATISADFLINKTDINSDIKLVYPVTALNYATYTYGTSWKYVLQSQTMLAVQDGTLESISTSYDLAIGTATMTVNRNGNGNNYATVAGGVTLENQFAICKFSFKNRADNSPLNDITELIISNEDYETITTVTPASGLSSVYVAMQPSTAKMNFKISVSGGRALTYTAAATAGLNVGKFYQPTLKADLEPLAGARLGDLFYQDGTYSEALVDGKTPIGVVAYVGYDADVTEGKRHGLVMALKNYAYTTWGNYDVSHEEDGVELFPRAQVDTDGWGVAITDYKGLAKTNYLGTHALGQLSDPHPNFTSFIEWREGVDTKAPTSVGTTDWFIPAWGQWIEALKQLGGTGSYGGINEHPHGSYVIVENINAAMAKAGEGNYNVLANDSYYQYWTTTIVENRYNWVRPVTITFTTNTEYGVASGYTNDGNDERYFRPFFAF